MALATLQRLSLTELRFGFTVGVLKAMSLLIFAAVARQEQPEGKALDELLRTLQRELPNSFVLPVTLDPPTQTQPEQNWDWVTLPADASRGLQLRMLTAYAAWLKPAVSLFCGDDGRAWMNDCHEPFGERLLRAELSESELIKMLKRRLPITLVLDADLTPLALQRAFLKKSDATTVQVHCPKALGAAGQRQLLRIAEQHDGPIHLILSLKHGLLRSSAARDVAFLYKQRKRIQVTVCDELGTPIPGALNRLWSLVGNSR